MLRLSLSMVRYVWSITVQHPAVIDHHRYLPETLIAVFHWIYCGFDRASSL